MPGLTWLTRHPHPEAFAPLDDAIEPRLLDDPVATSIARPLHKTPGASSSGVAVQRGTAPLTTWTNANRIRRILIFASRSTAAALDAVETINQPRPWAPDDRFWLELGSNLANLGEF